MQDSAEAANEKPLRITGTPESVEQAKALVIEIVNQGDVSLIQGVLNTVGSQNPITPNKNYMLKIFMLAQLKIYFLLLLLKERDMGFGGRGRGRGRGK